MREQTVPVEITPVEEPPHLRNISLHRSASVQQPFVVETQHITFRHLEFENVTRFVDQPRQHVITLIESLHLFCTSPQSVIPQPVAVGEPRDLPLGCRFDDRCFWDGCRVRQRTLCRGFAVVLMRCNIRNTDNNLEEKRWKISSPFRFPTSHPKCRCFLSL